MFSLMNENHAEINHMGDIAGSRVLLADHIEMLIQSKKKIQKSRIKNPWHVM